jgi:hypothetical protein
MDICIKCGNSGWLHEHECITYSSETQECSCISDKCDCLAGISDTIIPGMRSIEEDEQTIPDIVWNGMSGINNY